MIRQTVFCNLAVGAKFYLTAEHAEQDSRTWLKSSVTTMRQYPNGVANVRPVPSREVWVRDD